MVKLPRCPNCNKILICEFNEKEVKQKGKNMYCSYCKYLLWIPIDKEQEPTLIADNNFTERYNNLRSDIKKGLAP
ncbi:MAG: hypothetical protein UW50_C0001G0148 [Candidatus Wolfebacteria bacterium GW2011_GWA1_44_24]|uniref:Uncharacterized protein n=1 Tax=Candidatus Wolfebacteria bacterium GW2011_GWB1_41_12 TaxID=1619006 RepID=A0A0G0UMN9_9BACT|nr:MAG: hypothetical protein UU38_C0003G0027 [Candidatus Wolfebacteria bacterium GW2011_GWB1_41_12]KKT56580.1 MAG: hypothetical protein UW50_C0001G0148 [Candidatus Wolfebacteria bacterium GW2011_GWA1_44_24]